MDYTFMPTVMIFGCLLFVFIVHSDAFNREGKLMEYCSDENFHPQCSDEEVVVMQSARYGHIQLGKCIDVDLGKFGCFLDQLAVMDKLCSGKRTCDVEFTDSVMQGEFPCEKLPKAFSRYLEASFVCKKVFQPSEKHCSRPLEVKASSRQMFLSSMTTLETGCGAESTPWVLKATEGQKINITFIDFNWKHKLRSESLLRCPVQYGNILDLANNNIVNLCGGLVRERNVYLSEGNDLQVLINVNILDNVNFLIGFQAIGCPKFKPPPQTWVREEGEEMTVGCVDGNEKWRMRCIGTHWLGPQRDCSKFNRQGANVVSAKSVGEDSELLGMSHVIAFTLFGGMFVIITSIIITAAVGYFCIRRPRSKTKNNICLNTTENAIQQLVPIDTFPTYKSVQMKKMPKQRFDNATLQSVAPGFENTMSSVGSVPRYPAPSQRDSPHYYLLEGREVNDTEPLYDVVYQGLPTENAAC